MTVKSFVGGHDINVYSGCEYDPAIRKYRGGTLIAVIPYSGRTLSAEVFQSTTEIADINGAAVPLCSPQQFTGVDPLPDTSECDYCVVSAMYVAACKALGLDTSRLLTIGVPVAGDDGRVIGCVNLNRN